jgi:hypothetical protein
MNFFVERQHMNWVNKMPDKPLAVYDGLLPESLIGAQLRGGLALSRQRLGYAFYVANAPKLITDDPSAFGQLDLDNVDNTNGHFALGGRVGYLPHPSVEVGYGMQTSEVGPPGTAVRAWLHSVDVNYVKDSDLLQGILTCRAQWVWSQVGRFNYDPSGALGFGPTTFDNTRNGGYLQAAYRPSRVASPFFRNLEAVVRYDRLAQKDTPVGFDEQRWTFGLDYWFAPSTVAKIAYEFDDRNGNGLEQDAVMLQFVTGF